MEKERKITDDVLSFLESIPDSFVIKFHGGRMSATGMPDVHFVCKQAAGKAFWLETKRPGEKGRKIQLFRIAQLTKAGAAAAVVKSVEDVKRILELHGVKVT